MITKNDRTKDPYDVGLLFHSIIRYGEANEERLDCSVVAVGYDRLLADADRAAEEIAAQHRDEGDEWDGAVWFERLEDIAEGSLAAALYTDEADVPSIVGQWLAALGLQRPLA
ncbi:hypothetical protein [Pseudomonas sp. MWU12-2323]|uniref:hypothetical protein n=1 Tax=Pseudomonas sp. MWU12-2323 TaxID=2651296 RepID=UPI00128C8B91|nr:hypothetical protein [Pseudomonas sp. MWU12-2323]MPQ69454.1 hypothetical protein [Pseudomonas sp. MWU12-2323]